jgi:hypothetical protein
LEELSLALAVGELRVSYFFTKMGLEKRKDLFFHVDSVAEAPRRVSFVRQKKQMIRLPRGNHCINQAEAMSSMDILVNKPMNQH